MSGLSDIKQIAEVKNENFRFPDYSSSSFSTVLCEKFRGCIVPPDPEY